VGAVGSQLELPAVLSTIIEQICGLLSCERASLFVVDADGGIVSLVLVGDADPIRLKAGEGIAGLVVQQRESVRLDDAWADPRFHRATDELTGFRTRNMLAVPLIDGGVVKGVVEALNHHDGPFDDDDETLLLAISNEIALAVERARVFGELKQQKAALARRVDELDLLVDLDRAISDADGLEALMAVVASRVMTILSATGASVALIDKRTSALQYRAGAGLGQDRLVGKAIPTDTGLAGAALAALSPIRVDDAATDPRHNPSLSKETQLIPGPYLAVPMIDAAGAGDGGSDRALGIVTAVRQRGDDVVPFTSDDERLLLLVANRVSAAVMDEERRARAQEKAQLEAIGHMLAGIVHDFKTPMTVIAGYVQLMAAETDPQEREAHATTVMKSTDHMTAMIKELLSFARGDSTVLLRKVWLEGFADELNAFLERMLKGDDDPRLSFRSTLTGSARLDAQKIHRAVVNLVKNAKEGLVGRPGRGNIEVTLADDTSDNVDDVVISVTDDGPGIPPELEGRLFERFATFGKVGGTGLGLALVHQIAADHQGQVSWERPAQGGTRFVLRLPRG
jgi:signal transduction histidine kinase/putative methionine-R-sulfoxide reductase with GAF domain